MLLLNFSHPPTQKQLAQIEAITGQPIQRAINAIPRRFEVAEILDLQALRAAARRARTANH